MLWYSLEASHWDASNEYPQQIYSLTNKIACDVGTVLSGALRYFVSVCLSFQSESVSPLYCSGLQIRGWDPKLTLLFLNQRICCLYSKELSRWDDSFRHHKHMFGVMSKKLLQFYHQRFCLFGSMLFISSLSIIKANFVDNEILMRQLINKTSLIPCFSYNMPAHGPISVYKIHD